MCCWGEMRGAARHDFSPKWQHMKKLEERNHVIFIALQGYYYCCFLPWITELKFQQNYELCAPSCEIPQLSIKAD